MAESLADPVHRLGLEAVVELGLEQGLERDRRARPGHARAAPSLAARLPPALSPITAIRAGVDTELGRVVGDATDQRRVAVVGRGRVGVLGRQPVVDRDDDRVRAARRSRC